MKGQRTVGDKLHKLADVIEAGTPDEMYLRLVSQWRDPSAVVVGAAKDAIVASEAFRERMPDFTERVMLMDAITYLPDDILVKVDRAAMAVGLESRVPLLDHRVFEFAWGIPLAFKTREGRGKWILRQVLYRHVPQELIEHPKWALGCRSMPGCAARCASGRRLSSMQVG